MPHRLLTQALVDGPLEPGEYHDTATPGFSLWVNQSRRTFYMRVRERGRRPRLKLGHAATPTAPGLTAKEGRLLANGKLVAHAEGKTVKPAGLKLPLDATVAALARGSSWPPTRSPSRSSSSCSSRRRSRRSGATRTDRRRNSSPSGSSCRPGGRHSPAPSPGGTSKSSRRR